MKSMLIITPSLGRSSTFSSTVRSIELLAAMGVPVIYRVVGPEGARTAIDRELKVIFDLGVDASFTVEREARGLYFAINQVVDEERNKDWCAVTYINDDDCISSGFLNSWLQFSQSVQPPFSYGRVNLIDENGRSLGRVPTESRSHLFEALLAQGISPLNQQGMIIPRLLWEKLGGFRVQFRLCADLDFWLRAHRLKWPFHYNSCEVGQFRIRNGQLSGDAASLNAEILAIVAQGAPRRIGSFEKFYARWQFRFNNFSVYFFRLLRGSRLSGMRMLVGK